MRQATWLWLATGLVIVLLLIPLPTAELALRWPILTNEIEDFGHPVVFAGLTYLGHASLMKWWPWSRPAWIYAFTVAGALFFGLATEAVQAMIGRDSSWNDLLNDMIGAAFALLWYARGSQQLPLRRRVLTGLACVVAVLAAAPLVITSASYVHRASRMPVLWQSDDYLLKYLSTWQGGAFPGLVLREPSPDWQSWGFLEVEVESLEAAPTDIMVRVHDRFHDYRSERGFIAPFSLPAGRRVVLRIPLESVHSAAGTRPVDMRWIGRVMVLSAGRSKRPRFAVHSVRLAR